MYLSFYGLAEKPFSQTPDPKFLYWNDAYRETIASLRYGIQERKGFITMIGEAGTGKTTLLRKLLDDLGPDVVSVFLFNPNATFEEILEYTLSELGIPATTGRKLAMLQRLNDFLLAAFNEGKTTILLIDEAQDLETEVLESLRLLSNLETSKEKILQIVLSGQPELAAKLAQPNLRQLKQRIAVRCRLEPLGRHELAEYIAARVAVAGGRPDLFAPDTHDLIWDFARGIPRLVNTVCDNALLVGYALGRQSIDRGVVAEVVSDLARIDVPLDLPVPAPVAPPAVAATAAAPAASAAAAPVAPAAAAPVASAAAAPPPASAPAAAPVHAAAAPAAPHGAGPQAYRPETVDRARLPAARPRRGLKWAVAVLLLALGAAVALGAGGWAALEPRIAGLLERQTTAPVPARVAEPAAEPAPAPARRADAAPVLRETDEPAPEPLPSDALPDPEPAAESTAPRAGAPAPAVAAAEPSGGAARDATPPALAHAAAPADRLAHAAAPADRLARAEAGHAAPGAAAGAWADEAEADRPRDAAAPAPDDEVALDAERPAEPDQVVAAVTAAVPAASRPQVLQADRTAARTAKRIRVQRGDTLMNLATREYGFANYTTLDVLRAANPGIQDVNRIIAGSEIVFPDPGPGARVLDGRDGVSVLVATTPVLSQAQEIQRVVGTRYRLPADLEPVLLGDGRSLYRVSLRRVPDRGQALQIAESLGSILQDPS